MYWQVMGNDQTSTFTNCTCMYLFGKAINLCNSIKNCLVRPGTLINYGVTSQFYMCFLTYDLCICTVFHCTCTVFYVFIFVLLILAGSDSTFQSFGLCVIGSIKMHPTLVKKLAAGTKVGYSMTYEVSTKDGEWIATFPIGYADGVWRSLSSDGEKSKGFIRRDSTGENSSTREGKINNYREAGII